MSKKLPWFKFWPNEWNAGDITLEDYEAQGVFISVCAYYWERDCELQLQHLKKRFRNHSSLDTLMGIGVLKIENDKVKIEFLDEQFEELSKRKKKLSEAGKKGNEQRWNNKKNKGVLRSHGHPIAKPSPPNRNKEEDKEKDIYSVFDYWNSKRIIVHQNLNSEQKEKIGKSLGKYGIAKIKKAIDKYSECLTGDYFFSYKWSLWDFVARESYSNPSKFLPEGEHFENFKSVPKKVFVAS
ncbi:MAG: hypothetical protein AAGL29_11895 [Bacteroidota bacterium]